MAPLAKCLHEHYVITSACVEAADSIRAIAKDWALLAP